MRELHLSDCLKHNVKALLHFKHLKPFIVLFIFSSLIYFAQLKKDILDVIFVELCHNLCNVDYDDYLFSLGICGKILILIYSSRVMTGTTAHQDVSHSIFFVEFWIKLLNMSLFNKTYLFWCTWINSNKLIYLFWINICVLY